MNIGGWWPNLKPTTREGLIADNGDAVPAEILIEIMEAGGWVASDACWVGQAGPSGFLPLGRGHRLD